MAYYYSPFRKTYEEGASEGPCAFCSAPSKERGAIYDSEGSFVESSHYYWAVALFPKFEGHTLLVPKRHITSVVDETDEEIISRQRLLAVAVAALGKLYPGSGVEIFVQNGLGSASSIGHIHWHVVPAMPSDSLRGFEKLGHFYTTEEKKEKVILFPQEMRLAREELQDALSYSIPSAESQ